MPDPVISAWNKEDQKMKKEGTPKNDRPDKPKNDPDYPKKLNWRCYCLRNLKNIIQK